MILNYLYLPPELQLGYLPAPNFYQPFDGVFSHARDVGQRILAAPNYGTSNPYLATGHLPAEVVVS